MKIQQLTPGFALHVSSDWDELCSAAADLTLRALETKANLLMCAAAGQSTTRFYDQVHRRYLERPDAFQQLRVVALDEWAGLPRRDPATCNAYLEEHLVAPLNLGPERYRAWRSDAAVPLEETSRMRAWLEAEGAIDLCILGLGINGHLGLNEPGDALIPHAHAAALTAESRGHAMLAQAATTPALGYTFGVADLLASRRIILLVHGAGPRASAAPGDHDEPSGFLSLAASRGLMLLRSGRFPRRALKRGNGSQKPRRTLSTRRESLLRKRINSEPFTRW